MKCNTTLSSLRTTNYILVYSDDIFNNYSKCKCNFKLLFSYINRFFPLIISGGPMVDPMKLFLLTSRDTESNIDFTLSFTVSHGVPSRLRCVDGNNNYLFSETLSRGPFVSILSHEVIRSHYINNSYPDMTRVSITRTGQPRAATTYTCTVYVEGRINPENGATYNFRQMGNNVTTASITGECIQLLYSTPLVLLVTTLLSCQCPH